MNFKKIADTSFKNNYFEKLKFGIRKKNKLGKERLINGRKKI